MNTENSGEEEKGEPSEIKLSVPWKHPKKHNTVYGDANVAFSSDRQVSKIFVKERSEVHALYIKEKEKTRRLYLILSAVLFIASLLVVMFAPDGRETLSYWIGGTLLVFAAGAAGYSRLNAKAPMIEISADSENE